MCFPIAFCAVPFAVPYRIHILIHFIIHILIYLYIHILISIIISILIHIIISILIYIFIFFSFTYKGEFFGIYFIIFSANFWIFFCKIFSVKFLENFSHPNAYKNYRCGVPKNFPKKNTSIVMIEVSFIIYYAFSIGCTLPSTSPNLLLCLMQHNLLRLRRYKYYYQKPHRNYTL